MPETVTQTDQKTEISPLRRWGYLWLARRVMTLERFWATFWPVAVVLALFLAFAFADLLPRLPGWLHMLGLMGIGGATLILFARCLGRWRAISDAEVRHRVELDSGLAHRPLQVLEDKPMAGAGEAEWRLWRAHAQQAQEALAHLRVSGPRPGVGRVDRWGICAAAFVALVAGVGLAAKDPWAPLLRAVTPAYGAADSALTVELWITPPAYTGRAPIFLEGAGERDDPVELPSGSTLLAQIGGAAQTPTLILSDGAARRAASFEPVTEGDQDTVWRLQDTLGAGDRMSIQTGGRVLATWPLRVTPDNAPKIELLQAPARVGSRFRIDFEARDDYGIAEAQAEITAPDGRLVPGGGKGPVLALPISDLSAPVIQGSSLQDLSAHPWAGTPVNLTLVAKDGAGSEGRSDPMTFVLPERIFNHPVSRALAEARKKLNAQTPEVMAEVSGMLDDLSQRPAHFGGDPVVFLAMRLAAVRMYHGDVTAIPSMQTLLWDLALRIEDGEVSVAERQLEDAQRALQEAMRQGAGKEELDRLMQAYRDALGRYLQELAKMLEREGMPAESLPHVSETIRGDQLAEMLQRAQALAEAGRMDEAREVLAQMQRMLDRMRESVEAGRRPNEALQQARKLMDQLRDVQSREQQLLDKTFDADRRNEAARPGAMQTPTPGGKDSSGGEGGLSDDELQSLRRTQESIRKKLGEAMRTMDQVLGQIPDQLTGAEQAMREAEQALDAGDTGNAVEAETRALGQLGQAVQAASEQIAKRMSGLSLMQSGSGGQGGGQDPFGRRPGGPEGGYGSISGGDVKLKPGDAELKRAREILDELRRRAGDPGRSLIELDYIDRLLRRF